MIGCKMQNASKCKWVVIKGSQHSKDHDVPLAVNANFSCTHLLRRNSVVEFELQILMDLKWTVNHPVTITQYVLHC